MIRMDSPKLEELLDLPPQTLRALAEAFADGPLRSNLSAGLLAPFVGSKADRTANVLKGGLINYNIFSINVFGMLLAM